MRLNSPDKLCSIRIAENILRVLYERMWNPFSDVKLENENLLSSDLHVGMVYTVSPYICFVESLISSIFSNKNRRRKFSSAAVELFWMMHRTNNFLSI